MKKNINFTRKSSCSIKVGTVEVSGRTPNECARLAEVAQTLAPSNPVMIKHGESRIQAGTVEQASRGTQVSGKMAEQDPVEVTTPLGKFKMTPTLNALVGFGVGIAVDFLARLAWSWIKQKFFGNNTTSHRAPDDAEVVEAVELPPPSDQAWDVWFHGKYQMPALPEDLDCLIGVTPPGYKDAMLMHLTAAYGAICFSRVRSNYLDSSLHQPNLAVVIEAPWGTGKGKFKQMLEIVFSRVIERDKAKMNLPPDEMKNKIIQFTSVHASESRVIDILANNRGVHMYMFDSEILSAVNAMKKNNGLTFEHLRKSFDGENITRLNRDKSAAQGTFPLRLNYTLTGTPGDVEAFIKKEFQGGTTSRIVWCTIPKNERELPRLEIDEDSDMDVFRDQIDEWQRKYAYTTDGFADMPAPEYIIDLGYVSVVLEQWIVQQWDIAQDTKDEARVCARSRIAATAFHAAIVFHMMFGEPGPEDSDTRKKVVDLTLYVANYCMERCVHKFGSMMRVQARIHADAERVHPLEDGSENGKYYNDLSKAMVIEMKRYHDAGNGWGTTAKHFGYNDEAGEQKVKRAVKKLEQEMFSGQ